MGLTKQEIMDRIQSNLDDANVYYSEDDLNDSILDIYDDIVCQTLPFEKSAEVSFTGNKVFYDLYQTIPDYILPVAIYSNLTNTWLTQKNLQHLEAIDIRWEVTHGNPIYYSVVDFRKIAFYPHPSSTENSFVVYYKYRAPEADVDDILLISNHSDTLIVDGVTEDLLAQAHEFSKSSSYLEDYAKGIRQERTLIEGRSSPDRLLRLAVQDMRPRNGI